MLNVNKRNAVALTAYRQRCITIRESLATDIGDGCVRVKSP